MKLDVGCGQAWRGDVNLDLFIEATSHRGTTDKGLNVHSIPCFVRGDGQFLPFRNAVFDEVFSSHAIEHTVNPSLMLREMIRVLKVRGLVTVICPHRYATRRGFPRHISMMSKQWFRIAFQKYGLTILRDSYSRSRDIPHSLFPLFRLPSEISITGRKE